MKPKKSKKANLEKFRTIFFQTGMILTLTIILVAFEWESEYKYKSFDNGTVGTSIVEELIPITREKEKTEAKKPITPIDIIKIVDDHVEIEDPPDFIDEDEFDNVNWDTYFEDDLDEIDEPLLFAQFMPTFQGEKAAYFRNFIANNIEFPKDAIEHGVNGKVVISFVVGKDGFINTIEIIKGVHPVIDNAVIDVIKTSPKWEPGIQDGKYVNVKFSIAIAFQLQ